MISGFFLIGIRKNNCTPITSHLATIKYPGSYCLTSDIRVKENNFGIHIRSNDVKLDLGNFKIIGTGETTYGVVIDGSENVTVKNGIFKNLLYGILGTNLKDSSLVRNFFSNVSFRPIRINGRNVTVSNNKISGSRGTSLYPESNTIGIELMGNLHQVLDNHIFNIEPYSFGEAVGISISSGGEDLIVSKNRIQLNQRKELGRTIGIWSGPVSPLRQISNNVIIGFDYGLLVNKFNWDKINNNKVVHFCGHLDQQASIHLDQRNKISSMNDCKDTVEYYTNVEVSDKKQKGLYYRLATIKRELQYPKNSWLVDYKKSCALGMTEACKYYDIYKEK